MNIMQGLHCYLTQHSPHVLGTKCMFLEVLIEGMLLLLVKLHYFLPTRWQSLTSLPVLLFSTSLYFFSLLTIPSLCGWWKQQWGCIHTAQCWLLWALEGADIWHPRPTPVLVTIHFSVLSWVLLSSLYSLYYICAWFPCWQVKITRVFWLWILLC